MYNQTHQLNSALTCPVLNHLNKHGLLLNCTVLFNDDESCFKYGPANQIRMSRSLNSIFVKQKLQFHFFILGRMQFVELVEQLNRCSVIERRTSFISRPRLQAKKGQKACDSCRHRERRSPCKCVIDESGRNFCVHKIPEQYDRPRD